MVAELYADFNYDEIRSGFKIIFGANTCTDKQLGLFESSSHDFSGGVSVSTLP